MEVRGCFSISSNTDGSNLKWIPDGKGSGHFTGLAAFVLSPHVELLSKVIKNITFVEENKYGYRINATNYDGCLGRLQSNTSDFLAFAQSLNLYAPGIEVGKVLLSKSFGLLSAYDTRIMSKKQELIHTMKGIPVEIWVIVLLLTLIASLIMTFGLIVMKRSRYKIGHILKSILNYWSRCGVSLFELLLKLMIKKSGDDQIGSKEFVFKLMVFMVILLAFYVNFFATVIIKTNAVTLDRPKTIESFDDLINSDARPVFRVTREEHMPFKNSEMGSKKRMIWNKAVNMGIEKSLAKKINYAAILDGKLVLIMTDNPQPIMMSIFCRMFRDLKSHYCPIIRLEAGETDTLKMIMKSSYMSKKLTLAVDKMYQRIFEAGYLSMERVQVKKVHRITPQDDGCMSNRIVMPDPGFNSIGFLQMKILIVTFTTALVIAVFLLGLEHIVDHRFYHGFSFATGHHSKHQVQMFS